jgi:hypothetical protein
MDEFSSPHYKQCDDPECPVAWVFEAEGRRWHWHFTGSDHHPAAMPDDTDLR